MQLNFYNKYMNYDNLKCLEILIFWESMKILHFWILMCQSRNITVKVTIMMLIFYPIVLNIEISTKTNYDNFC